MSANLDYIRSELSKVKDLGTPIHEDLYSHLTEVFNRIMLHHPHDGFDRFETISMLVKRSNFKICKYKSDEEVNNKQKVVTNQEALDFIKKAQCLLDERPITDEKQIRGVLFQDHKCVLPNFVEQAETLEWVGIGFGEDTSYLIQKSLKRLQAVTGTTQLRFFGKLFGQTQDYWVAYGVLNQQEEQPSTREQEKRGTGLNATVFWVTHNLMNDWIQLPDLQPNQVIAARSIVKLLTGNLNATIDTNPPFPGKERHLLRAQLARI